MEKRTQGGGVTGNRFEASSYRKLPILAGKLAVVQLT